MSRQRSKIVQNTAMLYIMNIAKLIFPMLTLPYLTRCLSVESYAVVTYVKAVMTYVQLMIDFGFLLSATKDIVKAGNDKDEIGKLTGNVILGKIFLAMVSLVVLLVLCASIKILRQNILYTLLSFVYVALSIFLVDFLFRGLEKMYIITIRYFITRGITTVLTFLLIKNDSDLLLVPILEIIGNLVAIIWVWTEIYKMGFPLKIKSLRTTIDMLKDSFVYFLSNMASTAFMALNTLLVGIILPSSEVAYWGLAMQLVSAIQALYTPITNGIYPHMIREKNLKLIGKVLKIFIPFITIGCLIVYFASDSLLKIIGGVQYVNAAPLFRWLVPLLFISFPTMLFGWPVLGAIGRSRETTITTVITAVIQIAGLFVLIVFNQFSLINLAILRALTESIMCALRLYYCYKYRSDFRMEE